MSQVINDSIPTGVTVAFSQRPPPAWHYPRSPGLYVVKSAFDNPIGYDVVRIDEEQLESGALPSIAYGPIPEQKP